MARVKPAVPETLWPTLITAWSLTGDGPVVGVPTLGRVLVLVAHPDDEAIGCAGTIAVLADRGTEVRILALTDGEATIGAVTDPAETGRRRRAELERSAAILGAAATSAALRDGHLQDDPAAVERAIGSAIDAWHPDVVLAPWLGDGHPDHRAVAGALARVLRTRPVGAPDGVHEVWGYETWSAVPANRIVPISDVIERKEAALAAHETAALAFDISAGLGLSRWRSMHGGQGTGWAEAFLAADVATYLRVHDAVTAGAPVPDPR